MPSIFLRSATLADAPSIAALHAENWRLHYRGAFSDHYLDHEAEAERIQLWTERLGQPAFCAQTFLAFSGETLAGFICLQPQADEKFGTLLDNLHVAAAYLGQGIGKLLMRRGAAFAREAAPEAGIYLYVLAQNEAAIAVYERYGGVRQETVKHHSPAGDEVVAYRYVWERPGRLLQYL